MNTFRKITEWYVSVIASVIFAICAAIYFSAIKGLEKPAGLTEAFGFLLSSPKEYSLCLLCGGLAKISFAVLIVAAIMSLICLIMAFIDNKYAYEEIEVKDIIRYIVNIILAVIVGIVQTKIILNFWILVITIGIIVLCFKLWADNS